MNADRLLDEMTWDSARSVINWTQLEWELNTEPAFYDETLARAILLLERLRDLTPDDGDRSDKRYRY